MHAGAVVPGRGLVRGRVRVAPAGLRLAEAAPAAALPDLRAAFERAGRDPADLDVVPFGTIADAGKLAHYESLGCSEVVLRVPMGPADEVLRALDELVRFT